MAIHSNLLGNGVAGNITISDATNGVYSDKVIAPGDTYVVDWEKLVLGFHDTLQANANVASKIVATVSTIGL